LKLDSDRYWLVLGPFQNPPGDGYNGDWSNYNGKGFDYVYEPEKETAPAREYALPKDLAMSQGFKLPEGQTTLSWRSIPARKDGYVDLAENLKPNEFVVAFARMSIKSPEARQAVLSMGSDYFIKVWCNGQQVISHHIYRAAHPGAEKATVELKAGWNDVLIKVGTGGGGWGFFWDITGADGKPMGDLVYAQARE
jgi:hypothetical protein